MDTARAIFSSRCGFRLPGKLNKRQRELLAELGELTPVENKPQRRSLLGRVKDMFA